MNVLRVGLLSAVVSVVSLVAGCQSSGGGSSDLKSAAGTSSDAVMCSKCMTTWVKKPVYGAGGGGPHPNMGPMVTYRSAKALTLCPDCDKAAAKYMATGKLDHCDMCNEDLKVVQPSGM